MFERLKSKIRLKTEKEYAEFPEGENLQMKIDEQKSQLHILEKEVAYWKEKALNFKRFHQ